MEITGERYNLIQLHLHIPSEHEVEGGQFDMELHFAHENASDQLAELIGVSKEQFTAFAEIFPEYYRAVQPLNDRDVYKIILK